MAFERRRGAVVAAAALIALAGCQQGVEIDVDQRGGEVRLNIRRASGDDPPCIDSVSVYPAAPADALPVWDISQDSRSTACVNAFVYGMPPAGFGSDGAAPLRPGARYRVRVAGTGLSGAVEFDYRPDPR